MAAPAGPMEVDGGADAGPVAAGGGSGQVEQNDHIARVPEETPASSESARGGLYDKVHSAPRGPSKCEEGQHIPQLALPAPHRSHPLPRTAIEGWVLFVTGLHEEAQEDDVVDAFADFGDVKDVRLNLDRRTGFAKGYAFVEFGSKAEADAAVEGMHGKDILGKAIAVDFAFFSEGELRTGGGRRGGRRGRGRGRGRRY